MPDTPSSFSVDAIYKDTLDQHNDFTKWMNVINEDYRGRIMPEVESIQLDDDMIELLNKFENNSNDF